MAKFKHACGKSYNNPKPWSIPLQTNFLSWQVSGYPSDSRCFPNPPSAHSQIHWEEQQREPGFGADLSRFKSRFYLIQAEDLKHLSGSLFPVKKVGPLTTQVYASDTVPGKQRQVDAYLELAGQPATPEMGRAAGK